ncbi:MAG: shikimate dehydrogenase [Firmicutes bacterium]|nr:shikimate dehydrogenase [Bacillota bacterium]
MFGLVGKKLSHSFSKEIHEELVNQTYNLIELDQLDSFFYEKAFLGVNVTIPYKREVFKYLDYVAESATISNSVNTIINENGVLTGYNTDFDGLIYLLKKNIISINGKSILILGNGATSGTAKAVCEFLHADRIIVSARSPKENEYHFCDTYIHQNIQVIINATPNGMYPNNDDSTLIDIFKFQNLEAVIDLVYNPLKTTLLIHAEEHNIKAVNGLLMLVHQAVKACELFHKLNFDDAITDSIYKQMLMSRLNFVLVGMPMSGKSHFAKRLSILFNKEYYDIDLQFESKYNTSIPTYFAEFGESAFRDAESCIIKTISSSHNYAISTGGGAILREKNIHNLKQNGIIIFLDASLELLQKCNPKNRPLLKDKRNLEKLYLERHHLYEKYADIVIKKDILDSDILLKMIEVKINEYISS